MCVGVVSVWSRFEVRSSNRGDSPEVAGETERGTDSESSSLSESATCFPAATDDLGSSTPLGRVLMTAAERRNKAVREAGGSVAYLGGMNAAMFARRCTFASTPSTETN